jgi:hypothetical protein
MPGSHGCSELTERARLLLADAPGSRWKRVAAARPHREGTAMQPTGDEAIPSGGLGTPTPGLEGLPRVDMGALEESLPSLVDSAVQGPVVLTRRGSDAFVMLPLDAYRRLWAQAPRPPVIDVVVDETGA